MVTSRERRKVDVALTDVLRNVDPPLTPQTLCCRTRHSGAGRPGCFRCNWNSRDLSWSWYYHVTVANVAGQTRSWRKKPCVYRDLHTVHVIYKYKCTLMFTYTILGYSNRRLECFSPTVLLKFRPNLARSILYRRKFSWTSLKFYYN